MDLTQAVPIELDLEAELVAAYPNDERVQFALGGYDFGQTEYPQAIERYRKATELNAEFASAFNLLGYAYRQNVAYRMPKRRSSGTSSSSPGTQIPTTRKPSCC